MCVAEASCGCTRTGTWCPTRAKWMITRRLDRLPLQGMGVRSRVVEKNSGRSPIKTPWNYMFHQPLLVKNMWKPTCLMLFFNWKTEVSWYHGVRYPVIIHLFIGCPSQTLREFLGYPRWLETSIGYAIPSDAGGGWWQWTSGSLQRALEDVPTTHQQRALESHWTGMAVMGRSLQGGAQL